MTDDGNTGGGLLRVWDGNRLNEKRDRIAEEVADGTDESVTVIEWREARELFTDLRLALLDHVREEQPTVGDLVEGDIVGLEAVDVEDLNELHRRGLIDYLDEDGDAETTHDLTVVSRFDTVLAGPLQ